ncbi:hypothetical protein SUGI_0379470 [Cryptomeria japonica]|nr:hypothetical protein SUGI_0379470 [Cryptomeria japonica]
MEAHSNWMMVKYQAFKDNQCWKVIDVYGPTTTPAKKVLWHELSSRLGLEKDEKIVIGGISMQPLTVWTRWEDLWGGTKYNQTFRNLLTPISQGRLRQILVNIPGPSA